MPSVGMGMLLISLAVILVAWSPPVDGSGVVAGGVSDQHHRQDDTGSYDFGYQVRDPTSHQFRRESGDAYGRVVGSYGLSEADGRHRIVDYVADRYGFRAKVRTNEPGTASENSAAVQVSRPGHPPGPPRIPQPEASLPPPSGQSGESRPQSPLHSPLAYSGWPYGHPYYYPPVPLPPANSLYSPLGSARAPYVGRPPAYAKISDSYRYGQSPAVPAPAGSGYRYAPAVPEAESPVTSGRPDLAGEASLGRLGSNLPANYRVVPIPNGIRAVPVDSSAASDLGGGVYSPYRPAADGRDPSPAYPSAHPGYPDSRPAKTYYAYPSADYRFSGSDGTLSENVGR